MAHRRLAIVLVMLLGSVCSAQSAYDIRHYDLLIVPDMASKTVDVRAGIRIANPKLVSTFAFGLSDGYRSVTAVANGQPAVVERTPGTITVKVAKPAKKMVFEIDARGLGGKSEDENRAVVDDTSLFLLWSDNFYPTDFDQWATVTTSILLPEGFKAIAPGRLVDTAHIGTRVRYLFASKRPTVCFSVMADSRWVETERTVNGLRMRTLLYPAVQRYADQVFTSSADVVQFYSGLFNGYPFDDFTFFTIDGMYARRAFPGAVGYSPQNFEREISTTGHDAHETALLWWGYTTRGAGRGAWQWTEGFGDYAEMLYDEARHKRVPPIFAHFRGKYLASADHDLHYSELQGDTPQEFVHGKYPWIMAALREEIGDAAFTRGLGELFRRYRFRTFTMDEFIRTFEMTSGRDLRAWREEWLERKGLPPRPVEFRK